MQCLTTSTCDTQSSLHDMSLEKTCLTKLHERISWKHTPQSTCWRVNICSFTNIMSHWYKKLLSGSYLRYRCKYHKIMLNLPLVFSISLRIKYDTRHPEMRKNESTETRALNMIFEEAFGSTYRSMKVPKFLVTWVNDDSIPVWPRTTQEIDMNLIPSRQESRSLPVLTSGLAIWVNILKLL